MKVASELLRALFGYRRVDPRTEPCPAEDLSCCVTAHLPRLLPTVSAGEPVELILPAFPAKSPSRRKVLGAEPDGAEERGLRYLQRICDHLTGIYPPGVLLRICSDGRVFSDVVEVDDTAVTRYRQRLQEMITGFGLGRLSLFSLDDVSETATYEQMRQRLVGRYGETLEQVRDGVLADPAKQRLFNGLHRFLVEDFGGLRPGWSRTRLRADCRPRAYELIQRSNAWSRLLAERFPAALRLSIHPRHPHHPKIGVRLADAVSDAWITPWHGVALVDAADPTRHRLVPRHEAERLGGQLVYGRNGQPSHFVLAEHDVPAGDDQNPSTPALVTAPAAPCQVG